MPIAATPVNFDLSVIIITEYTRMYGQVPPGNTMSRTLMYSERLRFHQPGSYIFPIAATSTGFVMSIPISSAIECVKRKTNVTQYQDNQTHRRSAEQDP